jgi:hypothetical protein
MSKNKFGENFKIHVFELAQAVEDFEKPPHKFHVIGGFEMEEGNA